MVLFLATHQLLRAAVRPCVARLTPDFVGSLQGVQKPPRKGVLSRFFAPAHRSAQRICRLRRSAPCDTYAARVCSHRAPSRLNLTAALVVELCDGTRDLDQVRDAILPLLGHSGWNACLEWVDLAVRDGLLAYGLGTNCDRKTISAKKLTTTASQLREQGHVLPAFVCMTRVAELAPSGLIAFTLERSNTHPFQLTDSGRFTHHCDHVVEVAVDAGLSVVGVDEGVLRNGYGNRVIRLIAVLRAAGAQGRRPGLMSSRYL